MHQRHIQYEFNMPCYQNFRSPNSLEQWKCHLMTFARNSATKFSQSILAASNGEPDIGKLWTSKLFFSDQICEKPDKPSKTGSTFTKTHQTWIYEYKYMYAWVFNLRESAFCCQKWFQLINNAFLWITSSQLNYYRNGKLPFDWKWFRFYHFPSFSIFLPVQLDDHTTLYLPMEYVIVILWYFLRQIDQFFFFQN